MHKILHNIFCITYIFCIKNLFYPNVYINCFFHAKGLVYCIKIVYYQFEINDNSNREEENAMKNKVSKSVAKGVVSALNTFLRADANSASCCIIYQPKAPKELARYRRTK